MFSQIVYNTVYIFLETVCIRQRCSINIIDIHLNVDINIFDIDQPSQNLSVRTI